jgi:diguanylate cyclase (GGDEF)-like protein
VDLEHKLGIARKTELLAVLPEPVLRRLLEESREVVLDPNQVLFEEGTPGRTMYLVLEGEVEVFKGGRRLAVGGPGHYFGEMALIDGKARAAGLRATARTLLLEVGAVQFQQTIASNPTALLVLTRTISERSRNDLDALDLKLHELESYAAAVQSANHELAVMRQELEESNRLLQHLSTIDTLTGLANRRRFDEAMGREWRRAMRDRTPLSLIFCDIDFFKGYNDTYGHPAGDECLRRVARCVVEMFSRPADLPARFGGEEFVVLLANTDAPGAVHLAERLRANVEALRLPHTSSPIGPYLTISLGVAATVPPLRSLPADLISVADRALYQAKREGRNCVRTAPRAES